MNIFPLHAEAARKRHWVVRVLRLFGYLDAVLGTLLGLLYGRSAGALLLIQMGVTDTETARIVASTLGLLLGFCAGMLASLPLWGIALIADDIHALRIYASGMVVMDDRPKGVD